MADKYLWNIGGADAYLWKIDSKGAAADTELPFGFQAVISQTPEGKESVQLMDFDMIPSSVVEKIKEAAKNGKAIAKDDDDHGTPVFVTEEGGHYSIWDQGMYAARLNAQLTTDTVSTLRYDLEEVKIEVCYSHNDSDGLTISGVWDIASTQNYPSEYQSNYDAELDTVSLTWGGKFSDLPLTRLSGSKGSVNGSFGLVDEESGGTLLRVDFGDTLCVYWINILSSDCGEASYSIDEAQGDHIVKAHGFSGMRIKSKTVSSMTLTNGDGSNIEASIEYTDGTTSTDEKIYVIGDCYGMAEFDVSNGCVLLIFTAPGSMGSIDTIFPFPPSRKATISYWSLKGVAKMAKGGAEYALGSDGTANAITLSKDGSAQNSVALKTINGNAIVGEGDVETTGVVWVEY